jgi:hypothetical protein
MPFENPDFANDWAMFADMRFDGVLRAGREVEPTVGGPAEPPVMCQAWSGKPGHN